MYSCNCIFHVVHFLINKDDLVCKYRERVIEHEACKQKALWKCNQVGYTDPRARKPTPSGDRFDCSLGRNNPCVCCAYTWLVSAGTGNDSTLARHSHTAHCDTGE